MNKDLIKFFETQIEQLQSEKAEWISKYNEEKVKVLNLSNDLKIAEAEIKYMERMNEITQATLELETGKKEKGAK